MDPKVSSGTMNPTVPMTQPTYYTGLQGAPPDSSMQTVPQTCTTSSNTSNGHVPTQTPTHIHNGNQSVNSIAQKVPNDVPIAHGVIYGYNQLLNSQQNAGTRPRKVSCYNCGSSQHFGPECPEETMEQMLGTFRLKFRPTDNE